MSFSDAEISKAFEQFTGEIEQKPPMYSAVKFNGKKLYELARKGLSVDMKPRKIIIRSLDVGVISLPEVSFRVTCSKGTYIRQLCVDIGEALGCGGYLSRLERTRSGEFSVESAVRVETLREMNNKELSERLMTP
jgi:tRNA pseudouridine55 synthase